jgi:predicted  nucleic acid-binding Zn-ribbon protein
VEIESFRIVKEIDMLRKNMRDLQAAITSEEDRITKLQTAKLKRDQDLIDLKKQAAEYSQQETQLENKITHMDMELKQLEGHAGEVTDQGQMEAFEHQKEFLKKERDQLENQAIELLDQIELNKTTISEAEDFLSGVDESISEITAEVNSLKTQNLREIENLKTRIRALREQLPEKLLKVHMGLVKEKKDFTTTTLKELSCSLCGMSISRKDESDLEKNYDLIRCTGCSRIILPQAAYS